MSDLISSDDPFDADQKAALRDIVGFMIPAGSGRPAASDEYAIVYGHEFVLTWL